LSLDILFSIGWTSQPWATQPDSKFLTITEVGVDCISFLSEIGKNKGITDVALVSLRYTFFFGFGIIKR